MIQHRISRDFIVMEGNTLVDIPLDEILDTHKLTESSLTILTKEFDMSKGKKSGPKITDVDSVDIFGLSSWSPEQLRQGGQNFHQFNRVVFKTDKNTAKSDSKINVKSSLIKK